MTYRELCAYCKEHPLFYQPHSDSFMDFSTLDPCAPFTSVMWVDEYQNPGAGWKFKGVRELQSVFQSKRNRKRLLTVEQARKRYPHLFI